MNSPTLSYLTLAGSRYDRQPQYDMRTRAMMAADAGSTSIGVSLREPIDTGALRWADVPELEWVNVCEPVTARTLAKVRKFMDQLGCTRLNVGVCHGHELDGTVILANLEALAGTSLTVAFEPVAFGGVHGVSQVVSYTRQIGCPTVGLLFDLWHVYMDNWSYVMQPERVVADTVEVQVCGVPFRRPEHLLAASQDRPLISESRINIAGWLQRLRDDGYAGPVSYENPRAGEQGMTSRSVTVAADLAKLS
jgi:sugar phosphate isomerase/epimerase